MKRRYWFGLGGGLLALVLAGVLLGGTVFAQGSATPSTNSNESTGTPGTTGTSSSSSTFKPGQDFLSHLTGNLHVTSDQLQSAIKSAADQTIDDAVNAGKLSADQASKLKAKIDSAQGLGFLNRLANRVGISNALHPRVAVFNAVAKALNMQPADLKTELQSGTSISQIITNHHQTTDGVVNSVIAQAKTKLDTAVSNNKLTQDQETTILNKLRTSLTNAINNNTLGQRLQNGVNGKNQNTTPNATPSTSPTT